MFPDLGIILDAGSGIYRISEYLRTDALDIYLTHRHIDHTIGLLYMQAAVFRGMLYQDEDMSEEAARRAYLKTSWDSLTKVRIHGSGETIEAVRSSPLLERMHERAKWQLLELNGPQPLPESGTLTYFPLEHTVPCTGYRFEWSGRSLAYVTDTIARPGAEYIGHVKGVNILLHERMVPARSETAGEGVGHSNTVTAARAAAEAGVERLYFIHHDSVPDSDMELARSIFPETYQGVDGLEVDF